MEITMDQESGAMETYKLTGPPDQEKLILGRSYNTGKSI